MNNINLNSLKMFLEVANSKSFLDASNKLFISQPAISKSMSKLEEDLGIQLFYRANKGITLTPSGETLYRYLQKTKDLLLSCERTLISMNDIEEGKIVIGVQSHIVRNYLMDKIANFRTNHPKMIIELVDMSTNLLIERLEERKLDFVVDSSPIDTVYNNVKIEPICSLNTCFVKSVYNTHNIKSFQSLKKESLILPASRSSLRKNLHKCCEGSGVVLNPILEFETEELIIEATRRNLGVGYVVESAIQYLINSNILERIKLKEELPKMEINLVYINSYLTKAAKLFIKEEISNEI